MYFAVISSSSTYFCTAAQSVHCVQQNLLVLRVVLLVQHERLARGYVHLCCIKTHIMNAFSYVIITMRDVRCAYVLCIVYS